MDYGEEYGENLWREEGYFQQYEKIYEKYYGQVNTARLTSIYHRQIECKYWRCPTTSGGQNAATPGRLTSLFDTCVD